MLKQSFNTEVKLLVSEDINVFLILITALYQGYNPNKVFRQMHSLGGGMTAFYQGFEANLIARLGYLAIRNTLYKAIYDTFKPVKPTNDLTSREKAVIGGIAGGIAAYVTTPLTLISIRQIIDTQIQQEWRRGYSSVSSGLNALKAEQSTYKGSFANVVRHVALNASLTGPFDYFHEALYIRFGDFDFVKPTALLLASIVSTVVTLPFDSARTKIMNQHSQQDRNRLNYRGYFDVFVKQLVHETNPRSLWSGFYTYLIWTYMYAWLTVGITESFTSSWKRKQGLLEWQI